MAICIQAKQGDIAKTVFLCGDPLRAKFVAENFLQNARLVCDWRHAYYYTGTYNGKEVTVGTSGMGVGSMGIYAHDLFCSYDVDQVIRIGSSGAYAADMKLGDVILVKEAFTDSPWIAEANLGESFNVIAGSEEINKRIIESAERLGKKLRQERIHTTDVFYDPRTLEELKAASGATCVEMEAFTLFVNAKRFNKKASCLVTISDSLATHEDMPPEERERSFKDMIEIALGIL